MIKYQKNNIIFRMASAEAISKFKYAQAASFLQLTRKELDFNDAAKETVLLEFDRFSHWLFRVERICLAAGEGFFENGTKKLILDSVDDEMSIVENVMESYSKIFDARCIEYVKQIHIYSREMLIPQFTNFLELKVDKAFSAMAGCLSDYLQHLLLAFHEYNSNLCKSVSTPFICVSGFCYKNSKYDAGLIRARFFISNGSNTKFTLKNYSNAVEFEAISKFFESNHIELVEETVK